jgi:exodeoxyribonuclease V beta subunit
MSAPRDAMELPLDGTRVVEASAGTGKTFTIASLYLRLILERGLRVDEIVVATFTRAAAAVLSKRLRQRLVMADELLAEADPAASRDDNDGETREIRKTVARALHDGESLEVLRARAHEARSAIDMAFIGTLHGFCHRVLAEFGFDTGQALRQTELIDDIRELGTGIVRDFWRRGSADAATARLLADTWKAPESLARQVCDPRWRGRIAQVAEPDIAALRADFERARASIAAWHPATIDAYERELERCVKTASTRKGRMEILRRVHQWAGDGACDIADLDGKALSTLLANAIEDLVPKGVRPAETAFDDLAALCAAQIALKQAESDAMRVPAARLLQEARTYLDTETPRRLAQRNLLGHDQVVDRLTAALADPQHGKRAAGNIRARWKAALVDEFQDTDTQQWNVVRTLFGDATLILVGDPKQAIYGFRGGDVFAWLDARKHAEGEPLRLAESYRAGSALCDAVNALFSRPDAFVERGIVHPDIHAAERVRSRALSRNGEALPALQLWWFDPERIGLAGSELPSKALARNAIQDACVAWIAGVLDDPSAILRRDDGCSERLLPKHVAVLVNSNAQAQAMQAALGRAGVPACSNLHASVYASDEAADLALLVNALVANDDARRVRAARASVLIGDDASRLANSLADEAAQAALLEDTTAWVDTVRRHGPLPWLHGLVACAAPRLLALPDGERRIANYLQLAELLQALHARSFGLDDLAVHFGRARIEASDDADAACLRLDTDADAVTVSTVHAAKGLEYDVVLVPYAALAKDTGKATGAVPLHWYHDDTGAARVTIGDGASPRIAERAHDEILAEDVRKFYVAVTRASALCVLPWGPVSNMEHGAAFHLLHRTGREPADTFAADTDGCRQALAALRARAETAVQVIDLPSAATRERAAFPDETLALDARTTDRATLERDWQTWSFSRLVRGSANDAMDDPLPGAGDGDVAVDIVAANESPLAGARFGTAVHAAFEQTDFAAWRDATKTPDAEHDLLVRSLHDQGLAEGSAATRHAVEVVGTFIRDALNAELPCGTRLCDVPHTQRREEIEFHLALAPARTREVYALLHRHGYQKQRSGVAPQTLHGLLTGKIDLTFAHAGRFHIVDWKTNRCAPYDATALRAEIALHDYDLQWLIYTLALHRWLRQQLHDYDYDRHVGEVYYLFVRGMGAGRGIHVDRPPRALIETMDALFETHTEAGT